MIYIVRHGQTEWNLQGRKQGRKDSPLTLKGIEQAKNIANILNNNIEDYSEYIIVISPQWRCQQTASIICELTGNEFSECVIEEGLREHSFGMWEGKTEEEIEKEFPNFLSNRYKLENHWSYIVPMGESYELLDRRIKNVLSKYKNEKIIFICHEMVSKVMRGNILKMNNSDVLMLKHPQDVIYKIENEQLSVIKK
jgi:broad specificity phosphatase PhoE